MRYFIHPSDVQCAKLGLGPESSLKVQTWFNYVTSVVWDSPNPIAVFLVLYSFSWWLLCREEVSASHLSLLIANYTARWVARSPCHCPPSACQTDSLLCHAHDSEATLVYIRMANSFALRNPASLQLFLYQPTPIFSLLPKVQECNFARELRTTLTWPTMAMATHDATDSLKHKLVTTF